MLRGIVLKESIAPGEKLTYMTFVYTAEPAGSSAADMTAAFSASVAEMSAFDALDSTLCRGIAGGTVIEGWGTCDSAAPSPGLPDTDVSAPTAIALGAAGGGLLVVGLVTLLVVRRRQSRS